MRKIGAISAHIRAESEEVRADTASVTATSPRLDDRLRAAAVALDEAHVPRAETWRRVGEVAEELGLTRPGYDTIRLIVTERRRRRKEIRELLEPVIVDLVQGRLSAWDVERLIEADLVRRGEL